MKVNGSGNMLDGITIHSDDITMWSENIMSVNYNWQRIYVGNIFLEA